MQFELEFTNEPKTLPVVRACLQQALGQLPVEADTADALSDLALDAVRDAVAHAYPAGEEGSIKLTFRRRRSKLEILVRDFGMPQDTQAKESRSFPSLSLQASIHGVLGKIATNPDTR